MSFDIVLADERTLASLDFPAIRERLARHAMTDRAAARARALLPSRDIALVRLEQAATSEMCAVLAESSFALPRVVENEDALARARRGLSLAPDELRAIAVALAAAQSAVRRIQASATPTLQARCRGAAPLAELIARIERVSSARGRACALSGDFTFRDRGKGGAGCDRDDARGAFRHSHQS
jgi:dsDNA-specific endonuclease/ATPase MutS2